MQHENYPMPVLTVEQRNAAYQRLLVKGSILKHRLMRYPNSTVLQNDLIGVEIALAALTAKTLGPVMQAEANTVGPNKPPLKQEVKLIDAEKLLASIEEEANRFSRQAAFYKDKDYIMKVGDCINLINQQMQNVKEVD